METNHDWNESMQHLVRRSGCEVGLHTVKGFEEQTSRPQTISVVNVKKKRVEGDNKNSISNPWMRRFVSDPQRASTIIAQLNNYHRLSSSTDNDDSSDENPRAKNEVTPPAGGLKPPWGEKQRTTISEHPPEPPPLLLSGVDTTLSSSTSRSTSDGKLMYSPPKKGVPHVYHDYSNIPDVVGVVRKKTGGVTQPFPEKLHEMLNNDDDPSIVSWLPHGRAFLVRKPSEFTSQIMPK